MIRYAYKDNYGLHRSPHGGEDQRGGRATEDRGMLGDRTMPGHVLTLSYVIKRCHDKLKREKLFNLDFAMADFATTLPILI